jgi:NuA3 HAT complex component NTO1
MSHPQYRSLHKRDIGLVLSNALKYNAPDTTFNRIAKRIQTNSRGLLSELDSLAPIAEDGQPVDADVGDLEPSRILLEALVSECGGASARDRLADLFAFELEPLKEPTPPPPSAPPKKRVDKKKRWEEKEAKRLERAATGRSTRAAQAITEAFQHEAGLLPPPSSPLSAAEPEAGPSMPTRRTRNSMAGPSIEATKEEVIPAPGLSRSRSLRGVVGRELVERLSDRERREREQNLGLEIEAVDNSDQFTRFNTGWILPEGSKRARHVDAPVPPPLKPRNSESLVSDSENSY